MGGIGSTLASTIEPIPPNYRRLPMPVTDGSWTLFAHDADTGRTIWSQWIDGRITFRIDSPVDHIIAANKAALTADHPHRFGDYVHVAAVPLQLYHRAGLAA